MSHQELIDLGRALIRKNISKTQNKELLRIRNTVRLENPLSPGVRLVKEVINRGKDHENRRETALLGRLLQETDK